jgi:hypothetical protein
MFEEAAKNRIFGSSKNAEKPLNEQEVYNITRYKYVFDSKSGKKMEFSAKYREQWIQLLESIGESVPT